MKQPIAWSARWPRQLLIAVNGVTIVCLLSVAVVYVYARYRLNQIKVIHNLPLSTTPSGGGSTSDGLSPMNILLVGDNTREGLDPSEAAKFGTPTEAGGSHSDVTMILHLDPKSNGVSLLSIPRDLFVPLPPNNIAGKVGKIDSALNGTNYHNSDGAAQLIMAIENDLGIPINHYVQINFDGFQRTVDALGGINMYFPTQLYDIDAALHTSRIGCVHLNGTTALAVVRSRHLQYYTPGSNLNAPYSWPREQQSDLARIRRDHTFLRVLATTVINEGLTTDLVKLNDILGALISQVKIDPGLKSDLVPLVRHFRGANVDAIPEMTLPITVYPDNGQYFYSGNGYGQVDFPVEPLDHQLIAQWQGSPIATADLSSFSVNVSSITDTPRQATTVASALTAAGFNVNNAGQGQNPALVVETMIRYHPSANGLAQAETVLQALSGAVMMQADSTLPEGIVGLDVGSAVAVTGPQSATAPGTGSVGAPSTAVPTTSGKTGSTSTTATTVAGGSSGSASTATAVPTVGHQPPSSSVDQPAPWDPVACTPGQPVIGG
jgi:LCP family protein required for cell wall assembly